VDGTYVATSITDYLGPSGTPSETGNYKQQVILFNAGTIEMHELDFSVGGPDCGSSQTGTVTFAGNQATLTPTCPAGSNNGGSATYSATPTTFTLFDPPQGGGRTFTRVTVLTKQ
jgi:hypothetical protein